MSATPASSRSLADTLLRGSGAFWFVTAVIGQWIFIYFIAAFYGPSTFSGRFADWDNKPLIDGYIENDPSGNLMFGVHVLLAAIITLGGLLQLTPQIRNRARAFHRWNGRVYMIVAFVMALGGLYLVWVRGTYLSIPAAIAITLDAILIILFAGIAWRYAAARRIDIHRRWAMRTFMVVSGVWFLRVGMMAWVIVNQGPVGMSRTMDGPFDLFWTFGNYLVPLAFLELYFWAQDGDSAVAKIVTAGVVTLLTGLMAVGIYGTWAIMWSPYL